MKIIKKEPYSEWKLEVECNGKGGFDQGYLIPCGSLLEVNKDNILKRNWFKYPNNKGVCYGFICPVCGCFIEIKENQIDEDIKKLAKEHVLQIYQFF